MGNKKVADKNRATTATHSQGQTLHHQRWALDHIFEDPPSIPASPHSAIAEIAAQSRGKVPETPS